MNTALTFERHRQYLTFFPFNPGEVVARWTGSPLMCQNCLQVVVTAVVGAQIYREENVLSLQIHQQSKRSEPCWNGKELCGEHLPSEKQKGSYFVSFGAPTFWFSCWMRNKMNVSYITGGGFSKCVTRSVWYHRALAFGCCCISSFLSSTFLNFDLTETIFSCSSAVHSSKTSSIRGNLTSYTQKNLNAQNNKSIYKYFGWHFICWLGPEQVTYLKDFGIHWLFFFVKEPNHLNREVCRETADFGLKCRNISDCSFHCCTKEETLEQKSISPKMPEVRR